MTCRPDSNSVSGPNIGCSEVTLQPASTRASSPARSGVFSDPKSNINPARRTRRERGQQVGGGAERCRQNDEVLVERVLRPIRDVVEFRQSARRIGDRDVKPLRGEKVREPAAHLAAAADHQRAFAAALRMGRDARLFLSRERGLDQLPQQRFREIRRHVQAFRGAASAQNNLALAREIARRPARRALGRGDLLAQGAAARDQFDQLAVEFGQRLAQFIQIHANGPSNLAYPPLLLAARGDRKPTPSPT